MRRGYVFFLVSLFSAVFSLSLVSALNTNVSVNGLPFYNIANNATVNLTVSADNENITAVTVSYVTSDSYSTLGFLFVSGSNRTDAVNWTFSNASSGSGSVTVNLSFFNDSGGSVVPNGSRKVFSFDVTSGRTAQALISMTVNITGRSGVTNATTINYYPGFSFSGYVFNETGCSSCWQNGTNVSILGVTQGASTPPSYSVIGSSISNESGFFRISNVNASTSFNGFRLKLVVYNASALSQALKVGNAMPDFPKELYYGGFGEGSFDMSLNGANFYVQPAATLNLTANNGTTQVSFGYEVIDQALGYPIDSHVTDKVLNATSVVPSGRNYTVIFYRIQGFNGSSSGLGYINHQAYCNSTSDLMNFTHCPTPPKALPVYSLNSTQILSINQTLTVRKINVHGCLTISGNSNNSAINVTNAFLKMVPWSTSLGSFVPPTNGNEGSINISRDINYTYPNCFAYYNFSLLNNTGYMVEIYAKNGSNDSSDPGAGINFAGLQNVSSRDNWQQNITLYPLLGSYQTTSSTGGAVSVNTSYLRINILNSSGSALSQGISGANLKIKNTAAGLGTLYYIINANASGSFFVPILNNTAYVKTMIFASNGPPRENSLNLTANETNITLVSMNDADKGFRRVNSSGGLSVLDSSSIPITMRFLRNSADCATVDAPSSCEITSMNASSFNPLKALLAGKVHMQVTITSTNVSLMFHDYDMMTAKQPPMNSLFDQNASSVTSAGQVWNFGSFAPSESYSNVTITMPFSNVSTNTAFLNSSKQVNISFPYFYDENQVLIWNRTSGYTPSNLTGDFVDYNNSFYAALINGTNVTCSSTGSGALCFINTTANYISVQIPHFSSSGLELVGQGYTASSSDSSSNSSSSSSSSGGGGGDEEASFWTNTYTVGDNAISAGYTKNLFRKERLKIKVSGSDHYVGIIDVVTAGVTINVSSKPQQAVFQVGDTKKFELTGDNYYDLSILLNGFNKTVKSANITVLSIHDLMPASLTSNSSSNSTATNSTLSEGSSLGGLFSSESWFVWVLVVIVLVAIILAAWYFYNKHQRAHGFK